MRTSDFDYFLPPELIAQHPPSRRTDARMLRVHRGLLEHARVTDLDRILQPGDLLVLNDTRVIPARLYGRKKTTGGRVEVLLLENLDSALWTAMVRGSGHLRSGTELMFGEPPGEVCARIVAREQGDGSYARLQFAGPGEAERAMAAIGVPPVPPYIQRDAHDAAYATDRDRYQTVYARVPGAVAAPTAGLHFTDELLGRLDERGVQRTTVTLHVGPGTFRPVRADRAEDHMMESERYEISPAAAGAIRDTKARGGRIVAVGTTTVRTLETAALNSAILPCAGRTSLFIRPGHEFRAVDVLLTNFHLPRSTLLMLVCAFGGTERILAAYREAVRQRYRFYSYGDCMLID